MNQYLKDEHELTNAFRFSEEDNRKSWMSYLDCGTLKKLKDKYATLNARTRNRLPSYIGAAIATICALSFFSAGLTYKTNAEVDNFSYEHSMIG